MVGRLHIGEIVELKGKLAWIDRIIYRLDGHTPEGFTVAYRDKTVEYYPSTAIRAIKRRFVDMRVITRERSAIIGDHYLRWMKMLRKRTFVLNLAEWLPSKLVGNRHDYTDKIAMWCMTQVSHLFRWEDAAAIIDDARECGNVVPVEDMRAA